MPVTAEQARGELAAMNAVDMPPQPDEIAAWSEANLIYIYNVSPEKFVIEHPLVGKITINACPEGKPYSEPTIIKGMIPYGVRVEMQSGELRHESGRQFAVDALGLGAFKNQANSLVRRGVFIAANDTFDGADMAPMKIGKKTFSMPRWVNPKHGKCAKVPTKGEIERANKAMAEWDFAKIQEADRYQDNGPANKEEGSGNITAEHRQALRRRGQIRDWDKPQETLQSCPGCQEKIRPGVIVHTCGAVLDWDKAVNLGMRKAEDRPKKTA